MSRPLPLMGPDARALLTAWAKGDAPSRPWTSLLRIAGPSRIEAAEELAALLEREGWATLKRTFVKGSRRLDGLTWADLPAMKALLGLDSRDDRRMRRTEELARLAAWAVDHPELAAAVEALQDGVIDASRVAERFALLQSLVSWREEQRSGTHKDFELHARGATKSITDAEWRWLEAVDLAGCGIEGFAPVLWLAGALELRWSDDRACDLMPLHLAGLPVSDLLRVTEARPPRRYWLIENRASFERQAQLALRMPDIALLWLPGRPPLSWQAAVGALLDRAPAPAWVSADPDPAGVEIAMTAGALWSGRGLVWEPHRMGVDELEQARHKRALDGEHDPRVLARLAARPDLPHALRQLCDHMAATRLKGEQEGWL